MKTKIIGLAAITLALVMTMGTVSANSGYNLDTTLSVNLGSAYQDIDVLTLGGAKWNQVTIGNYYVDAVCEEDPEAEFADLGEALDNLIVYLDTPSLKGTADIVTTVDSILDADAQYVIYNFEQKVDGTKAVVRQETIVGLDVQELLLASDDYMDFEEKELLRIQTCRDLVTLADVYKNANLDVNLTVAPTGGTVIFHTVDLLTVDPVVVLYQYAEGPNTDLIYDFTYTNVNP